MTDDIARLRSMNAQLHAANDGLVTLGHSMLDLLTRQNEIIAAHPAFAEQRETFGIAMADMVTQMRTVLELHRPVMSAQATIADEAAVGIMADAAARDAMQKGDTDGR